MEEYLSERQYEAMLIHELTIGLEHLLDEVQQTKPNGPLTGARAIVKVMAERSRDLQNKLDSVNLPKVA